MGNKLMVSYDIHDEDAVVHGQCSKPALWLVRIMATNRVERITIEIVNKEKCVLNDLNKFIEDNMVEAIGELSPVTEAKFAIYRRM